MLLLNNDKLSYMEMSRKFKISFDIFKKATLDKNIDKPKTILLPIRRINIYNKGRKKRK